MWAGINRVTTVVVLKSLNVPRTKDKINFDILSSGFDSMSQHTAAAECPADQ